MKLKKAGAVVLIVLVVSLIMTGTALAHATLIRSLPAANAALIQPPTKIEMWFSEPLETEFSSVRLLTTSGDEIPVGTASLDPNDPTHLTVPLEQLSPGIYTVSWVSLSRTDGHEWFGSFPFIILNSDGSRPSGTAASLDRETGTGLPTSTQTASRWLALMGGILFMSVPLFLKFVTPGLAVNGENDELGIRFNNLGGKIVGLGVLALFIGSWLQFAIQATQLENLNLLLRLIYGTHTGALALARQSLTLAGLLMAIILLQPSSQHVEKRWIFIAGVVLEACLLLLNLISGFKGEGVVAVCTFATVGVVWGLAWHKQRASDPSRRQPWTLLLALGLVTLLFFSIGSHAGAVVPGSFWAIVSDFIHLLATSAWVGGLMLLPIVLEQIRQIFPSPDKSVLGLLFRRYGNMAKFSFFLLITTGLFNSLVQFPNLISLINTVYGRLLLIKLLLVIGVWWISLRGSHILRRSADPSGLSANLQRFNQQMVLAALISLLLMFAVAALVQTQPPINVTSVSPAANLPYHKKLQGDDLTMHLQVNPKQVGNNQFKVYLSHTDGSPIGDVQLVRLLFDYQDAEIGQSSTDLNQLGSGVFGIDGAYLNQPGSWKISVYVRRRGLDDVVANLQFNIPEPANAAGSADPFQNPAANTPVDELLAGTMMILGFELYRWRRTLAQVRPKLYPILMLIAFILFFIGVIILSYAAGQSGIIFLPEN